MDEDVKGRGPTPRAYDASSRRESARANRRAVVDSARDLLEERGLAATTIAEVARRAGVSPRASTRGSGRRPAS
ncbi:helix-turn-helix domain-containing protein [Nocardioides aquaticus]|uniref:helix-turn-helix domain-containing protein n=1 Tax=Nocardioides aquaticus TaxID=160826 RepID=UPI001BD29D31|nr:helix-turn-helix domain-containing protein [Nocardioides aquaticus]